MTEEFTGYQRALDGCEAVLCAVPADGWAAPSPCTEWSARDVAGHLVGGQHMIRDLAAAGGPSEDVNTAPGRFAGADPVESWRAARKECAAALTPVALRRQIPFGELGEVPLRDFLDGYILELLVHTWDIAQATGRPARLDADLVHHAFATARVIARPLRQAGLLGPERPAPRRADELTRLLAFMGRSPGGQETSERPGRP
ncbi:MAG TPA: TIGR03086 family metal-binding protein [Streptosporangiaceae bacterium]|nr:TIGR03086 family metal-binding protein [Streptosporangiaceae bacterium]